MGKYECTKCGGSFEADSEPNQCPRCGDDDSGSFVASAVVGAITGSAILGGLIGGDFVGGILGDLLDGDLSD